MEGGTVRQSLPVELGAMVSPSFPKGGHSCLLFLNAGRDGGKGGGRFFWGTGDEERVGILTS